MERNGSVALHLFIVRTLFADRANDKIFISDTRNRLPIKALARAYSVSV